MTHRLSPIDQSYGSRPLRLLAVQVMRVSFTGMTGEEQLTVRDLSKTGAICFSFPRIRCFPWSWHAYVSVLLNSIGSVYGR
jgi:hypothetical protein